MYETSGGNRRNKKSPYECTFCNEHLRSVPPNVWQRVAALFLIQTFRCPHCFHRYIRPLAVLGRVKPIQWWFAKESPGTRLAEWRRHAAYSILKTLRRSRQIPAHIEQSLSAIVAALSQLLTRQSTVPAVQLNPIGCEYGSAALFRGTASNRSLTRFRSRFGHTMSRNRCHARPSGTAWRNASVAKFTLLPSAGDIPRMRNGEVAQLRDTAHRRLVRPMGRRIIVSIVPRRHRTAGCDHGRSRILRFRNSTHIGAPACSCRARIPVVSASMGSLSVKSRIRRSFKKC